MSENLSRREFIQVTAAGNLLTLSVPSLLTADAAFKPPVLVSPGCRKSKVKVGKLYIGTPKNHWPTPLLDLKEEVQEYEKEFGRMKKEFADVDFTVNELITSADQLPPLYDRLKETDGILAIQVTMGIDKTLSNILSVQKPTILFAIPYSGHDWVGFGALRNRKEGARFDCILSSDKQQLAAAVRPFRAIHHLREAKILNITTNAPAPDYLKAIKDKFGTEIKVIGREPILEAYESISDSVARQEADQWIAKAEKIVEPSKEEIIKSCKLALAFQKVLDAEEATVMSADCYGSMYHQLPAFPCIGWVRFNNMGLGGICESDLRSAMTHIIYQGLVGKPGFISDPTLDVSKESIILAHCLGSTKMDGPEGETCPYLIRSIMERQEGAVIEAKMRIGQKVTQAILIGTDLMPYFTGEIIDTPESPRGCRTKITVKVDGDIDKLWQNWSNGLHRQTCYGNIVPDLQRFCRFQGIKLVNEA